MDALGYVYNRAAANLRRPETGLIGLVINELRNAFFTEFATAAQMTFAAAGYATVVANTDEDGDLQAQVTRSMIEHGVSAVLISPTYGSGATFDALRAAKIPTLQVLRDVEGDRESVPFASFDYASGSRAAVAHLSAGGPRRYAFVGGHEDWPITAERMTGFSERGGDCVVFPGRPTRRFGQAAAAKVRAARADAVLCFNDLVALGLLAQLVADGARVGQDVRLVGFDDVEECALCHPALSSVRCDSGAFGRVCATHMLAWLSDGVRPPAERRAPVSLVVRASSGAP